MTTQRSIPQAIFPDIPRSTPAVDENGNFSQPWLLAFSSLFQALQKNFSNEGLRLPQLTDTQLNTIAAIYTPFINKPLPQDNPATVGDPTSGLQKFIPDISGAMVFDSVNRVPKVFIITYNATTPPTVATAGWKTYTIT